MILLDTDVLIAHLRGHQAAREWLRSTRVEGRLAASAITVKELTDAMRSPERREIARLLSTLSLKPVTLPIARRAGALMRAYRRSHSGIGSATAWWRDRRAGSELATLNVRHFPMFEDLRPPFAV